MSGQVHAPEALLPGKEPPVTCGPQRRSGRGGKKKNPYQESKQRCPARK